jgi:hypothetical protein
MKMKKLLIVLVLLGMVGTAGAQSMYVKPQAEITYTTRLANGASLGVWTKIRAAKRDTSADFYILNTGGRMTMTVQCSLKGTSTFSCGYQATGLGKTYAYRSGVSDSIAFCNAVAASGNYPITYDWPYAAWGRLTFSNPGGDSLYYKIDSSGGIGWVRQ